jgi:hypothetical protein
MSTYKSNADSGCGTGDFWNDMEMVMFELTTRTNPPPRMWRLGKIMAPSDYTSYPLINKKGTRVYFTSNWNVNGGNSDIYRIDLPTTWYQDLSNLIPIIKGDTVPPAPPKGIMILK